VLATWVSKIQNKTTGDAEAVEARMALDLRDLQSLVGGSEFAEVVRLFAYTKNDAITQACVLKWLNAEYTTKTEAYADLGVRRIIDDSYDTLKLMATFVRKAGFGGLFVTLDELVVISHRFTKQSRSPSQLRNALVHHQRSIPGFHYQTWNYHGRDGRMPARPTARVP
jgi:hypothetical protein